MDINLNTTLKQEQTLSPQMLQSLALLPMPVMELKAYIQNEIESNPALEIPETDFESIHSDEEDSDEYDEEASDRKQQAIENTASRSENLPEHLMAQLGVLEIDDNLFKICEMLIGNLDDNGFFDVPLETLFEKEKFSASDIKKAVSIVQSFDPYGVCVPDFRQSLIVQARCSGMRESDLKIFESLVIDHLEKVKAGKNREVAAALHISEEDLDTFVSILKSFTPFPGGNYDTDDDGYIVPEFSVHKKNGALVLEMNNANLPDLEISKEFLSLGKTVNGPGADETSSYIKNSINQAKNLISQVEMRYKTLSNCAKALVHAQRDFFLNGPMFLKALTLKDIAQVIGVHETTMSRLAQSKWVDTDWGLFQLKYFFSQGVKTASEDGESVSRNVVKEMIAEILKENPKLSDQKISDKLLEKGVKCARRTVGKYRAELNIDSSYSRI